MSSRVVHIATEQPGSPASCAVAREPLEGALGDCFRATGTMARRRLIPGAISCKISSRFAREGAGVVLRRPSTLFLRRGRKLANQARPYRIPDVGKGQWGRRSVAWWRRRGCGWSQW